MLTCTLKLSCWDQRRLVAITQPSIVLGVKACLAAKKAAHCTEACKGAGMLWYGYLTGEKVELVQPFL